VEPSCRLPSPHRVPACPVRDTPRAPCHVKVAQAEGSGGGGALALTLIGMVCFPILHGRRVHIFPNVVTESGITYSQREMVQQGFTVLTVPLCWR
jgi:hypothetical protein